MYSKIIESLNFHFITSCNMRCKFCFAVFEDVKHAVLPKGMLSKENHFQLIKLIGESGYFKKINFVGGEPTLCPWLCEMLAYSKSFGLQTSVVTNGSRLTPEFLDQLRPVTDWIGISIDSGKPDTHQHIGRSEQGTPIGSDHYIEAARLIRSRGIRFKVNTVVCSMNWDENMIDFIEALRPERWKLFQVLAIEGQNTNSVEPLLITREQFQAFCARHMVLWRKGIRVIPEDNDTITGSYMMMDPAGRFFDNVTGQHRYSQPVLEIGIDAALGQVGWDYEKFVNRDGNYYL